MDETKKDVNYVAVKQFLDQMRPFIIERYYEIYHYNPFENSDEPYEDGYVELLFMLEACYEEDILI